MNFDKDKVIFKNSSGYLRDIKFYIKGLLDSTGKADISVELPKVKIRTVLGILKTSNIQGFNKKDLKDIKSASGSVGAYVSLKGKLDQNIFPQVKIDIIDPEISHKQIPSTLSLKGGNILLDKDFLKINDIDLKVLDSKLKLSGHVTDFANKNSEPKFNIKLNGSYRASSIKKYLDYESAKLVKAEGNIPLTINLNGNSNDINILAQAMLDRMNYISSIVDIDIPENHIKIIKLDASTNKSDFQINDLGLYTASRTTKTKDGFYVFSNDNSQRLLFLEGLIAQINNKEPLISSLQIKTPNPLLIKIQDSKDSKLSLIANLTLGGKLYDPKIRGNITASNVSIPVNELKVDEAIINFNSNDISLSLKNITLIDSVINGNATLSKRLVLPLLVKNIDVKADYINMDKISNKFHATPGQDLPLIINKGTFSSNRLVLNSIANDNVSFDLVINPLNILKISNFKATTAKGNVNATVNMNLKTTEMALDLKGTGMDVNEVLYTTAGMNNEVFGNLNSTIKIRTFGFTPDEITYNTTGNVRFDITNGKLPKLGSLNFLLRAPNIIKGFSSSRLDTILGPLTTQKTENFDNLKGSLVLNRGIVNIKEITSQGRDLSLFIEGNHNIRNNHSDMIILGRLSSSVMKVVSPIKKLSVDKLFNKLNKIPGGNIGLLLLNGGIPGNQENKYPNLDKVPVLSRTSNTQTSDLFAVILQGNTSTPSAVKSFKWLTPQVMEESSIPASAN